MAPRRCKPCLYHGGTIDPKESLAARAEAALQAATAGDPAVQQVSGALVREAIVANEPVSPAQAGQGRAGRFHGGQAAGRHEGHGHPGHGGDRGGRLHPARRPRRRGRKR
ncbi:MAG: hypothetical protein WDN45_14965 [Caulobacteraceae bacterium]